MNVLIISGGEVDIAWAKDYLASHDEFYVISVDGGLKTADALSIRPDHMVGDFDTVDERLLKQYEKMGIRISRHKPEKDDTDTELALKTALEIEGVTQVMIIGALGGRFDHALANVEILRHGLEHKVPCRILDRHNKIYLLNQDTEFKKTDLYGKYISFIPYTDEVRPVTLEGFKYPLDHAVMKRGVSLGISNEISGDSARISFSEGIMICIESRD